MLIIWWKISQINCINVWIGWIVVVVVVVDIVSVCSFLLLRCLLFWMDLKWQPYQNAESFYSLLNGLFLRYCTRNTVMWFLWFRWCYLVLLVLCLCVTCMMEFCFKKNCKLYKLIASHLLFLLFLFSFSSLKDSKDILCPIKWEISWWNF